MSVKATIRELEDLQKSEDELGADGIEELEKALAEYSNLDDLHKSGDEDDEDGGEGEDDDGEDEGDEDDGKDDSDRAPIKKSQGFDDFDLEQELVKASEEYAKLEGTVDRLEKSMSDQMDEMRAAMADLTGLVTAIGKGTVTLSKSLKSWGAEPGRAAGAIINPGKRNTETLQKSKSEVVSLVKSAVQDGLVAAIWMSKVSVHGPDCLPDNIRALIPGL